MRLRMLSMFTMLFVLCTGAGLAQTTSGSITGTVVDPQDAAVANATVTVKEEGKGYTLTSTTDGEGHFVFPVVPSGTYTLVVKTTSFKTQERKGVMLVANDKLSLGSIKLEIGAVSEVVQVTSDLTPIQADSGERSFGLEGETIRNTGVSSRSFINLATLAPGVVANGAGDGSSSDSSGISVNGVRTNSNNVQIDGITSVDVGNNSSNSRIPLDSVGEFKLLTSTYQPEYGRSSGAQIIAVTRSGSKDFHGSFYYYRRHTGLNANTFDNNRNNRPRPITNQSDKGYTIGGPIYIPKLFNTDKKKLFFFWNQETAPRVTPNTVRNVRVPTALERTGDFSQSRDNVGGDSAKYIKDWTTGLPCTTANTAANPGGCFIDGGVLGKIPANRLYGLGLKVLSLYPLPNYTPVGTENFNYTTQFSSTSQERNYTLRIDYNVSKKWRINGRYLNNLSSDVNPYTGLFNDNDMMAGNLGIYTMSRRTPKKSFAGTVSGTINSTTLVEFTYGFNNAKYNGAPSNSNCAACTPYTRTATGLQALPLVYPNAVENDILSQFTFGTKVGPAPNFRSSRGPQDYTSRTDDIAGSLSKVWGNHVTKVGVLYHWSTKNQTNRVDKNGAINFGESANNTFDTNQGFSNAATGVFQNYTQASLGTTGIYKYFNLEPYVQDNWKITKRFVLDYGVRLSWMPPAYDTTGKASNFDLTKWSASQAPRLYVPVCINGAAPCTGGNNTARRRAVDPAVLASGVTLTLANTLLDTLFVGRIVPGSGNVSNGLALVSGGLTKNQGLLIAPRFGFAYDVTGKHNLILRGGFGIFYDRPQGNLVYDFNQSPPTTLTTIFDFGLLPSISSTVSTITPPNVKSMEPNAKIPSTNSYNFGVQYKLPFDVVLDAAYVGSQGHHLPRTRQLNETPFGSAFLAQNQDLTSTSTSVVPGAKALPVNLYRPYRGFGSIASVEFRENSNYHSLQISATRRFSKGLLLSSNYTLSRARGITSSDQGSARIDGNDKINYGRLGFDRTHNLVFNWVYELPKPTKNRYLGYVTNGWQLSGIYRFQSGEPELVTCGITGYGTTNITGSSSGDTAPRCVLIGDPKAVSVKDDFHLFNIAAFQAPAVGSTGLETNRDKLLINAPPINSWNLSISKKLFLWEKFRVEGRLDAFNALNHTQVATTNFGGAVFTAPGSSTLIAGNAANEITNRTGFGAANNYRPNRTVQWMLRFEF